MADRAVLLGITSWLTLFCLVQRIDICQGEDQTGSTRTVTKIARASDYKIEIDESEIRCKLDKRFVSFAISAGLFNKSLDDIDFNSEKLRTILTKLSPAVIRIGGTRANYMYYKLITPSTPFKMKPKSERVDDRRSDVPDASQSGETSKTHENTNRGIETHLQDTLDKQEKENESNDMSTRDEMKKRKIAGFKDYVISPKTFDALYELINTTGNTMLYDVSAFPRDDKKWNTVNARLLLKHVKRKKYNIIWQLGNEPNHYKMFSTLQETREQSGNDVAADYADFRRLLDESGLGNAKVVGPDVTHPKVGGKVDAFLTNFLDKARNDIDYVSWHQYYVDGRFAKAADFLRPRVLDRFVEQNKLMKLILDKNNFTKPVWITETGSAWGGGAKELSNRFVGMFPWVDKLGVAGLNCIRIVARQALFSGNYEMIEPKSLNPRPDFFASSLFKRLATNKVLSLSVTKPSGKFRVYARCAKETPHTLPESLFLFVLNLHKNERTFSVTPYELFDVRQYLFTADTLTSDTVRLNGKVLYMNDTDMPAMRPKLVQQPVTIPGRSIGYYVIDRVTLKVC